MARAARSALQVCGATLHGDQRSTHEALRALHSTRRAFLRSLEQKIRRLLHAAAGLAKCIGDRRRRHRRKNLSELCECLRTQVSQSCATERAKPHSTARASRRRVPSPLGNGPYRGVLRRRRHLLRRGVRRDWQRLRRGLRTQTAARWQATAQQAHTADQAIRQSLRTSVCHVGVCGGRAERAVESCCQRLQHANAQTPPPPLAAAAPRPHTHAHAQSHGGGPS
jgi:hypothetical protein